MGKLKKHHYEKELDGIQVELNNLAHWLKHTGRRMVVIFEGRDTAGKGGAINAIAERLNPRQVRSCYSTAAGTTGRASRR